MKSDDEKPFIELRMASDGVEAGVYEAVRCDLVPSRGFVAIGEADFPRPKANMNQTHTTSTFTTEAATEPTNAPFYPARLMTPSEVQNATAHYADAVKERTKGHWYLCGDVSLAMFAVLKAAFREQVAMRITAFATPAGARYAVISHQVHSLAHRFLLPLYEPRVAEFILGMRSGKVGFSMGQDGEDDSLLLGSPMDGKGFMPILALTEPLPREKLHDALAELPQVINTVKEAEQIPSLRRGEPVIEVNLSVILPTHALMRFWRLEDGGVK